MNDGRFIFSSQEITTPSWQDKRAALMVGGYSKGESRTARGKQERKEAKLRKKAA